MEDTKDVPDLIPDEMDVTNDDDDDDENSDGWEDAAVTNNKQLTKCLFCSKVFTIVEEALEHATVDHGFNLPALKARLDMDCFSFIKMINYIRQNNLDASDVMGCKKSLWDDDQYMQPVQQDDPWLMFDFDDLDVPPSGDNTKATYSGGGFVVNAENGRVTLLEVHFLELQKKIQSLSAEVRFKDSLLEAAAQDMQKMRVVTQNLMQETDQKPIERQVGTLRITEDQGYFDSYAHFGIHHEMLSDKVRTISYRDAILKNESAIRGQTVLDLGCGSGILSMFAAKAGASKVIGVDQSEILFNAMDIIRENGLENSIELVKGRIEDVDIPADGVEFIISEWMGYFLLFEGMLDSVIYARKKYLKPGGHMLPSRCSMLLVGISDEERHKEVVDFWTDVYGFRMTSLANEVLKEPFVEVVPSNTVATTSYTLKELDLRTCEVNDYEKISTSFSLEALNETKVTAIAGYFDTFFDLPAENIYFSTGPLSIPTHWKQTVFYLKDPVSLKKGEKLEGKIVCQRHRKEVRSLEILLSIRGLNYKYNMC